MKDKIELHTDDIKQISIDFDNPAGISNIAVDAIVNEWPTAKPKRKLFKRIKCFFLGHKWGRITNEGIKLRHCIRCCRFDRKVKTIIKNNKVRFEALIEKNPKP